MQTPRFTFFKRGTALTTIAVAGFAAAAVLAGAAIAKSFTLNTASDAAVTNFNTHVTTHENILVALSHRHAVYSLSGDSKSHPECVKSNGCFGFWPPLTVSSPGKLSKAPGIKGKLSIWKRDGFDQVVLNGHPLYFFSQDSKAHDATGQDIKSFGGTWSVRKADASSGGSTSGTTSTMTTSTTTNCVPYPGYPCS